MSDVVNFKDMRIEFDRAKPFLPFEQLMAVLPAASRELLPKAFQVSTVKPVLSKQSRDNPRSLA